MQLARAEAQVAITTLLSRFPDMALSAPDAPPRYTRRTGMHGLESLDVVLAQK
jgi:cytochrome P450